MNRDHTRLCPPAGHTNVRARTASLRTKGEFSMFRRFTGLLAAFLIFVPVFALAQTITKLKHAAPDGAYITFQLTDGTVLAQGGNETDWWKLTPDNTGSYVNGTWQQMASLPSDYSPLYFASAVLADGRLVISGGEYNFNEFAFTNLGAIYDPTKDKWTKIGHPKGWGFIGDSPSIVLPSGQWLVGEKMTKNAAYLDPATLKWTEVSTTGKNDENAEEGWTLMPDGSVLTYDVKGFPDSEHYVPSAGEWVSLGSTGVILRGPQNCCGRCIKYGKKQKCYNPPGEVGPAILRPDGTVFATGSIPKGQTVAHTAIWSPSSGWTAGPNFPNGDQAFDTFAALLPDGNVLVEGSNDGTLYEFDGTNLNQTKYNLGGGYNSLMVLPTGEILIGGTEVYQPTGTYQAAWAPTITSSPSSVTRGSTYQISGTQFNGLSQANAFGDELQTQTNYPLVRITNNSTGDVFYARTHDHSTMGVATGSTIVSTNFDVPTGMETGASSLVVVANGIPSTPVSVTVN
jgi:WD40 repeat protein